MVAALVPEPLRHVPLFSAGKAFIMHFLLATAAPFVADLDVQEKKRIVPWPNHPERSLIFLNPKRSLHSVGIPDSAHQQTQPLSN
jgi:hypothetical protein